MSVIAFGIVYLTKVYAMTLTPFTLYLGELNDTPLGDFRFAVSDFGAACSTALFNHINLPLP